MRKTILSGTDKRLKTLEKETKKQKQALLEQLVQYPIVQAACKKTGVGRATYYAWCKDDKEFAALAHKALHEGKLMVNDMAESQLIRKIQDGDNTAIIFWLKNHNSDYNERDYHYHQHEHEIREFSKEEKASIRTALYNAGMETLLAREKKRGEKKD